ncbi:hypothetical protein EVJ58_g4280 [Rhodofomes roseus]|uniref:Uncharacterized protein n=1 Tax=Rhodofomes roseus TaxID=34475 RepID=A0A4Y9YK15_9APHY|nr:hypothetical protein EVJ58_g4280 [Rhodofomes roseus]
MAFVRLRKLRIAAFPSNHSIILLKMFEELPPTVVELELRYHAWPSPQQLVPTATLLPNLRVLEMHQERAWCSLCNTCNVLRLKDDPVTITYTNGDGLPVRASASVRSAPTSPLTLFIPQKLYNRYLAPLLHLRTVRLSAAYTLYGSVGLQDLKTPWRGECGECTSLHLTDEAFVADWEAQNKEEPHPPSLRKVIWTFAPVEEEESSEEDTESDYVDDLTRLQERYWMELDHDSDDDSGWDSLGSGDEN